MDASRLDPARTCGGKWKAEVASFTKPPRRGPYCYHEGLTVDTPTPDPSGQVQLPQTVSGRNLEPVSNSFGQLNDCANKQHTVITRHPVLVCMDGPDRDRKRQCRMTARPSSKVAGRQDAVDAADGAARGGHHERRGPVDPVAHCPG